MRALRFSAGGQRPQHFRSCRSHGHAIRSTRILARVVCSERLTAESWLTGHARGPTLHTTMVKGGLGVGVGSVARGRGGDDRSASSMMIHKCSGAAPGPCAGHHGEDSEVTTRCCEARRRWPIVSSRGRLGPTLPIAPRSATCAPSTRHGGTLPVDDPPSEYL